MKKVLIVAVIGFALIAFAIGILINKSVVVRYPPPKLAGLDHVSWAGGYDGGVWIGCREQNDQAGIFKCDIYAEDGTPIVTEGLFQAYRAVWDSRAGNASYEQVGGIGNRLDFLAYVDNEILIKGEIVLRHMAENQ